MFTFKQLDEMGAQLVAGRVIYRGRHVEGEVGNGVFTPAPGESLGVVSEEAKPARATRAKKAAVEAPADDNFDLSGLDLDA